MLPHEEKILIEVFKDEELDVFGVFKKRRRIQEERRKKMIMKRNEEILKKKAIILYRIVIKKLIDCYGKEGAIPYLKALFSQSKKNK